MNSAEWFSFLVLLAIVGGCEHKQSPSPAVSQSAVSSTMPTPRPPSASVDASVGGTRALPPPPVPDRRRAALREFFLGAPSPTVPLSRGKYVDPSVEKSFGFKHPATWTSATADKFLIVNNQSTVALRCAVHEWPKTLSRLALPAPMRGSGVELDGNPVLAYVGEHRVALRVGRATLEAFGEPRSTLYYAHIILNDQDTRTEPTVDFTCAVFIAHSATDAERAEARAVMRSVLPPAWKNLTVDQGGPASSHDPPTEAEPLNSP